MFLAIIAILIRDERVINVIVFFIVVVFVFI